MHMFSGHKVLIYVLVILFVVVSGYSLYLNLHSGPYTNEMRGTVLAVSNGSLTVQGYLNNLPTTQPKKLVTIEFTITDKTTFTKHSLIMNATVHKPGEFFTPPSEDSVGNINEIKQGMPISLVKSSGNLFNTNKAEALEVDYSIFTYENKTK